MSKSIQSCNLSRVATYRLRASNLSHKLKNVGSIWIAQLWTFWKIGCGNNVH